MNAMVMKIQNGVTTITRQPGIRIWLEHIAALWSEKISMVHPAEEIEQAEGPANVLLQVRAPDLRAVDLQEEDHRNSARISERDSMRKVSEMPRPDRLL